MAKITVAGDAVIVTSEVLTLDDIKTLKKYRPESLTLFGGEDGKEPLFVLDVDEAGKGNIGKYGASFGGETHDEEKLACITMVFASSSNIKDAICDQFGSALIALNELEKKLPAVLDEIKEQKDYVMSNITVL